MEEIFQTEEYKKLMRQVDGILKGENIIDKVDALLQKFSDDKVDDEMEDLDCLIEYLITNNDIKNPLDRDLAEKIIEYQQHWQLKSNGGYPLWEERSFEVNGEKYGAIAYGVNNDDTEENAIFGIVFVKEDE